MLTAEAIAAICHDANRRYCLALGDTSQPTWEDAPAWQKESAIQGVRFHQSNPNAGPRGSHESWCRHKLADGWRHGPTKDPEAKTHPCLVPFEQLPPGQQLKDHLFVAIVHALSDKPAL